MRMENDCSNNDWWLSNKILQESIKTGKRFKINYSSLHHYLIYDQLITIKTQNHCNICAQQFFEEQKLTGFNEGKRKKPLKN